MKNTIAKIVQHTKNGRIAYMQAAITCVRVFNDCQAYVRVLTLIALCLSSWFTAGTAQAQEATGRGFELASAEAPGRLFALDTAESAPAASLQLSMAEPGHFRISDSLQSSVARPNGHHTTEQMDFPGFYSGNFTLALAVLDAKYGPPASNHPLNAESILSEVEAGGFPISHQCEWRVCLSPRADRPRELAPADHSRHSTNSWCRDEVVGDV